MDDKGRNGRERVEGDMGEGSFSGSLSKDKKDKAPAERVPPDAAGREAPALGWSTDRLERNASTRPGDMPFDGKDD